MIDSHCHLDHEPLMQNLNEIILRSKDAGITKLLTICTNLQSFENIPLERQKKHLTIILEKTVFSCFKSATFILIYSGSTLSKT